VEAGNGGGRRGKGAVRWLRISLRSVHLTAVSVWLGASVYAPDTASLPEWLALVVVSGVLLVGTDLRDGLGVLREVRGAAILVKLALLAALPLLSTRLPLLLAVVALSAVVSHMPGRYRYWVLGRGPG
jgi:hypothetical protein